MVETLVIIFIVGTAISSIIFVIQSLRKRPSRKLWGIAIIFFVSALIISCLFLPDGALSDSDEGEKVEKVSETEKFAKDNNISVALAEDLKRVLGEMELTDKSRVGAFHYELSDVYDWQRVEDWAEGRRYSGWMDMEHIFYYYVKDDRIVSVRTSEGDFLYQTE